MYISFLYLLFIFFIIGFISFVVQPLFSEFERYLFPCSTLSEQLKHLSYNKQRWQDKIDSASKPVSRPNSIDLSLASVESDSDIPSPTPSVDSDNDENEISECNCSKEEYTYLHDIFDRRHSVPVLNLLRKTRSLVRRRSFPNGFIPELQEETVRIDPVLLLENLAGKLAKLEDTNNNNDLESQAFSDTLKSLISGPSSDIHSQPKYLAKTPDLSK